MFVVRKVAKMIVDAVLYSVSKFYSRIFLKKLSVGQLLLLRKVEDVMKIYVNKKAEVTSLKLCTTNQLIPNVTKFELYV